MANGIHQGLVQPQLDALTGQYTAHGFGEQFQQGSQLQRGRERELSPAKPLGRHSRAVDVDLFELTVDGKPRQGLRATSAG